MQEELVNYETAKLAKKAGFDEKTWEYYNGSALVSSPFDNGPGYWNSEQEHSAIAAPTQSLLAKWLRDAHCLHIEVNSCYDEASSQVLGFKWQTIHLKPAFSYSWYWKSPNDLSKKEHPTYEEALEAGLAHALTKLRA